MKNRSTLKKSSLETLVLRIDPKCWGTAIKVLCMIVVTLNCLTARAVDSVPLNINYQGKLTDSTGGAVTDGNYELKFQIWSDATAGTLIWGKVYPVHIVGAYFNVVLGEGGTAVAGAAYTTISDAFNTSTRYLGLTITKDATNTVTNPTEIQPRQQFLSAPYALRSLSAGNADTLGNLGTNSFFKAAGGTVSGSITVNGSLTVAGAVTNKGTLTVAGDLQTSGNFAVKSGNTEVFTVSNKGVINGGLVPQGGIILWSGDVIPVGWTLCDGSNGSPDLRGRFVIGRNGTYTNGKVGGASSVTLQVANIPAHTHTVTDSYFQDSGANNWLGGGASVASESTGQSADRNRTTSSAGSGDSFSILPPYYALAYIQRVD